MPHEIEPPVGFKIPFEQESPHGTIFGYEALVKRGSVNRAELAHNIRGYEIADYSELAKPGESIIPRGSSKEIVVPEGYVAYRLTAWGQEDLDYFDELVINQEYRNTPSEERLIFLENLAETDGYARSILLATDAHLSAINRELYSPSAEGLMSWDNLTRICSKAFGVENDVMVAFINAITSITDAHERKKHS